MGISGINGSNCILSSMAKCRVEKGWLNSACIKGIDSGYVVHFLGSCAEWKGKPLVLSNTRNPYEPRIFKSIDGAASELSRIGITKIELIMNPIDEI